MNTIDDETNENNIETDNNDPMRNIQKRINLDYQHARMIEYFVKNKIFSYKIVEADSNYYKLDLNQRKGVLGAHSIDVLCKTIVLENTAFDQKYESDYYRKYYMAIVQYTQEIHAERIAKSMKAIQNANSVEKLSNKYFHYRLAKDEDAFFMTGYKFNCITPFLSKKEDLQILLPKNLFDIYPQYFWIGGGELELKVGISIEDFKNLYSDRLFIVELSVPKKNIKHH